MYILLFFLFFVSCSPTSPEVQPDIEWADVAGTTWSITEELNIYQHVCQIFRFGHGDTIYVTRMYWNPKDKFYNSREHPNWIRYTKGPLYNKHYENDPKFGTPNLVYTWSRKEYADPEHQIPVTSYATVDDWFLWKIDSYGQLLMGQVALDRNCYYWEFTRE